MDQPSLFDNEPDTPTRQTFALGDSEIQYVANAFTAREADRLFQSLLDVIPWRTATLTIAGQKRPLPRLQCWMADQGRSYSYSGLKLSPHPWNPDVLRIKARLEQLCEHSFNSVLLNYYRDGSDSVSWHADDETELGPNPIVASVSLGAQRTLEFKPKFNLTTPKKQIVLGSGSILIMGKTIQNNWLHQLPKISGTIHPRISLTFRNHQGGEAQQ
ncbi:MAG: alpha-ketoglutarate-dependent dioxygenase AlkB family protein [Pseudohongiellaceae bacterium]|jgi:alkylated DNA repair dioxygenase AlkB|nr:alpha-ketoglutarate-dependent dioxygenase AlkB [Gammaproteobacteria bacterium]